MEKPKGGRRDSEGRMTALEARREREDPNPGLGLRLRRRREGTDLAWRARWRP